MNARIIEVGRTTTHAYGVRFVVCANAEVIGSYTVGSDETGNGWKEEAKQAVSAAVAVINRTPFDYATESQFRAYNGGSRKALVEADYFTAEIGTDEFGDEELGEWDSVKPAVVPAEFVAKIETIFALADAAMTTVMEEASEQADKRRAEYEAEKAAEEAAGK